MKRFLAHLLAGLVLFAPVAALATSSDAAWLRKKSGATRGDQRAVLSSVGLKLLKTWVVTESLNDTTVDSPVVDQIPQLQALPGTTKTVKCPKDTQCLIEVMLVSNLFIQTAASYGNGLGYYTAEDGYFGQLLRIDTDDLAYSYASSTVLGADFSTTAVASKRVGPGNHTVSALVGTVGGPQMLINYSLVIRLYKR